jgi:hypothetical protein
MSDSRTSRLVLSAFLSALVAGCGSDAVDNGTPTTPGLKRITLIGPADSLPWSVTYQMTALNDGGQPILSLPVVWSSSAPAVADISGSGLVTPRTPGVTTISAAVGSVEGQFVVRVGAYNIGLKITDYDPLRASDVPPGPLTVGNGYKLSATLSTSNGIVIAKPSVTWSSSNPAIASVDLTGLLVAHLPGQATITAVDDTITGSVAVTVNDAPLAVAILPPGEFGDTVQLAPGQGLQFVPIAYYAIPGDPARPTGLVTWSSTADGIATVSQTGVVTGVAPGSATIVANVLQHQAARTIRVVPTAGTATIRMISAADNYGPVSIHPSTGVPATLVWGGASEQVVPAGTLQLSLDGIPPSLSDYNLGTYGLQAFLGFLPAGSHETFIAVTNPDYPGGAIAWLNDRTTPVPADSSVARAFFAAPGKYNLFFTDHDAPASLEALLACYLDWPFGYTAYSSRMPGAFDIVLLGERTTQGYGPELARFPVTASAGHASTFIITGSTSNPASLRIFSVVDK